MDRYPYHEYTILLGATRALAHIGVYFTHHVFGLSSTHVPDTPCFIYFSFNGQSGPDHRVPSSHVCQRMMCLKPLEVTHPFLAHRCTSLRNGSSHSTCLHNDGNCSAHNLYKGLWVKNRWWLAITPRTTSTSTSSTCHLHMSNKKLRFLFT